MVSMYKYECKDLRAYFTFEEPAQVLCRSILLTKYLSGGTISKDNKKLSFHAHEIKPLDKFVNKQKNNFTDFTYEHAMNMITHLSHQLYHLENMESSFLWIDPKDIFVVNNQYFLCFGNAYVTSCPLGHKRYMKLSTPISINKYKFASHDYKGINSLPVIIPYQASYYSLGAIVISSLFPGIDPSYISPEQIKSIKGTKLYWFLLRTIADDPTQRRLLFV